MTSVSPHQSIRNTQKTSLTEDEAEHTVNYKESGWLPYKCMNRSYVCVSDCMLSPQKHQIDDLLLTLPWATIKDPRESNLMSWGCRQTGRVCWVVWTVLTSRTCSALTFTGVKYTVHNDGYITFWLVPFSWNEMSLIKSTKEVLQCHILHVYLNSNAS